MKKIFTIVGVSMAMFASAQTNLFNGSDFNDWAAFTASLNQYGLKYGTQAPTAGINGTSCLNINSSDLKKNDYILTVAKSLQTTGITAITLKVKGTSGGLSFNVGNKNFNIPGGTTSDVTLSAEEGNLYTGSIAAADWITVTLDLAGVSFGENGPFAIKLQKNTTPNLLIDDIVAVGVLVVGDVKATKANLVKNTVINNEIIFGETSKVSVFNMNGQVVKSANVTENSRLNVSELPKGIYIVSGTVNGQAVSQKVMKK